MKTNLNDCIPPKNYDELVIKKIFSLEVVHQHVLLEKFFYDIGDYKGPFKKSMFVSHRSLIDNSKEIGVNIIKSKIDGFYYIDEEKSCDLVLFDINTLDIVEDEEYSKQ